MRSRRGSVLLVIVTLAAGALAGACGDDGDSDATTADSSESSEPTDAESTEATDVESSEATQGETSEATESVNPDSPIPFAVGNQWEYRIEYAEPIGTTIYTQEVKAIEPTAEGDKATLRVDYRFLNKNQPDFGFDIFYTVHPDGANILSVPFTAFGIGDVNFVNSGTKGELGGRPCPASAPVTASRVSSAPPSPAAPSARSTPTTATTSRVPATTPRRSRPGSSRTPCGWTSRSTSPSTLPRRAPSSRP